MMNTPLTINSMLDYAARIFPNAEIVSLTHDHPYFRYTFADAIQRIRKLANALKVLGATPGNCIGTLAWNDHRHFELYYAVSCSGMVCHTVNPRLFPEQVEYIINHAEDDFLFVDPQFLPLIESITEKLNHIKGIVVLSNSSAMPETSLKNIYCYESLLEQVSGNFEFPEIDENSASALCYTSGTTGRPKGVLYSHRSTVLHSYSMCMPNAMNLGADSVVMPLVPMFHVNAWGLPYAAFISGCKLVFPGPRMMDGQTLTDLINKEKVTYAAGVPTIWMALLDYLQQSNNTVESLKNIVVGGAACPLTLMEVFEQQYDVYVHAAWGMTELSPLGAFNPGLNKHELGAENYARQRIKAGRIPFGMEMKIVDDNNNELPWDGMAFGSLKVRGPWVCQSYFNSDSSASHDDSGWFNTGDVATIDQQGFMQITDRQKDVIKSGGEWISSIELENIAANHPAVLEAAVIGLPHQKWSERPLLVAVLKEGISIQPNELLEWFNGKVANWWIPNDCIYIEQLPQTATGKVDKKGLRRDFADYQFSL